MVLPSPVGQFGNGNYRGGASGSCSLGLGSQLGHDGRPWSLADYIDSRQPTKIQLSTGWSFAGNPACAGGHDLGLDQSTGNPRPAADCNGGSCLPATGGLAVAPFPATIQALERFPMSPCCRRGIALVFAR